VLYLLLLLIPTSPVRPKLQRVFAGLPAIVICPMALLVDCLSLRRAWLISTGKEDVYLLIQPDSFRLIVQPLGYTLPVKHFWRRAMKLLFLILSIFYSVILLSQLVELL
jgi:hypothetical protein